VWLSRGAGLLDLRVARDAGVEASVARLLAGGWASTIGLMGAAAGASGGRPCGARELALHRPLG
jgi:hypothetical protein